MADSDLPESFLNVPEEPATQIPESSAEKPRRKRKPTSIRRSNLKSDDPGEGSSSSSMDSPSPKKSLLIPVTMVPTMTVVSPQPTEGILGTIAAMCMASQRQRFTLIPITTAPSITSNKSLMQPKMRILASKQPSPIGIISGQDVIMGRLRSMLPNERSSMGPPLKKRRMVVLQSNSVGLKLTKSGEPSRKINPALMERVKNLENRFEEMAAKYEPRIKELEDEVARLEAELKKIDDDEEEASGEI